MTEEALGTKQGDEAAASRNPDQVTRAIAPQTVPVYADEIPPFDSVRLTFEYDLAA